MTDTEIYQIAKDIILATVFLFSIIINGIEKWKN